MKNEIEITAITDSNQFGSLIYKIITLPRDKSLVFNKIETLLLELKECDKQFNNSFILVKDLIFKDQISIKVGDTFYFYKLEQMFSPYIEDFLNIRNTLCYCKNLENDINKNIYDMSLKNIMIKSNNSFIDIYLELEIKKDLLEYRYILYNVIIIYAKHNDIVLGHVELYVSEDKFIIQNIHGSNIYKSNVKGIGTLLIYFCLFLRKYKLNDFDIELESLRKSFSFYIPLGFEINVELYKRYGHYMSSECNISLESFDKCISKTFGLPNTIEMIMKNPDKAKLKIQQYIYFDIDYVNKYLKYFIDNSKIINELYPKI